MNDFVSELDARYPQVSPEEVQAAISRAHQLRYQAMRDALTGVWGVLRRNISAPAAVRHA